MLSPRLSSGVKPCGGFVDSLPFPAQRSFSSAYKARTPLLRRSSLDRMRSKVV